MPSESEYAGLGRRFVAQLVDVVLLFVVGYGIAIATGSTTPTGYDLQGGPALLWFGVGWLYFIGLEARSGQTVGKRLAGIVVEAADGRAIDLQASVVRNVLRIIDFVVFYALGVVLILLSERNQRLGDRVAGTVVVRQPGDGAD